VFTFAGHSTKAENSKTKTKMKRFLFFTAPPF